MPEELVIPPSIEAIIQQYDSSERPVEELQLQGVLSNARQALADPTPTENLGAWSEAVAFFFSSDYAGGSPWGTHFAPMGSGTDKDGKTIYFPEISGTPPVVLRHWETRARSVKHPVLKARYADLVWDFTPLVAKTRRDPEMARIACDAYITSASPKFRSEIFYRFDALSRALSLAILLNDAGRIDVARAAIMEMHRSSMRGDMAQWWRAFDRLINEKRSRLTDDERTELIVDAERVVQHYADPTPTKFDPHTVETAARKLIQLYQQDHKVEDIKRLRLTIAKAFEHFASLSDPMLAAAVLQTSVDNYRAAGDQEASRRARIAMQAKIGESKGQMKEISSEVEIKKDDVEKFLASVVTDDLGTTLVRLAVEFLPKKAQLEESVQKSAEEAPLMAHISQHIMSDDRVVAIIGSVDEDPFGRLFQQIKFTFSFSQLWLREALNLAVEKHNLMPEHFVGWVNRHNLFDDVGLLREGVSAWFDGDEVKATHVLVPQIERALRSIAGQLGKPVTKAHPKVKGASVATNMGDILYAEDIAEALGPDLTLYFLALYADPRGLNIRNELAHGLLDLSAMHDHLVRLLIHTLLVLGVWKELAAKRR